MIQLNTQLPLGLSHDPPGCQLVARLRRRCMLSRTSPYGAVRLNMDRRLSLRAQMIRPT